jgi:hypothetical protein
VITFAQHSGTARSCLTTTPWTADFATLVAWVDAVPALVEGTGPVAAFEAISEALAMFQLPSGHTPANAVVPTQPSADAVTQPAAAEQGGPAAGTAAGTQEDRWQINHALLMLWLSEAHAAHSVLVRPPGAVGIRSPQVR